MADKTNNVVNFIGNTRLDISPEMVLEGAKGKLKQVLILGVCDDGDLYVGASTADKGKLLLAVETFKLKMLSGYFDE